MANNGEVPRSSLWAKFLKWIPFCKSKDDPEGDIPIFPWKDQFDDNEYGIPTMSRIGSFKRQAGRALCMANTADGLIYIGSTDHYIWCWRKLQGRTGFSASNGPIYAIAVQQADFLLSCHHDGTIRTWEKVTEAPPNFLKLRTSPTFLERLINRIRSPSIKLLRHGAWNTCINFTEDMRFAYSGSMDHTMRVWRFEDWKLVDARREHKQAVTAIAAGCNTLVFSGSNDGSIIMWERKENANAERVTHSRVQVLLSESSDHSVNALLFKYNGGGTGELYAGLSNGKLMVWQERDAWGPPVEFPYQHEYGVTCLARSPGPLVFSGSGDGTIFGWRNDTVDGVHTCVMQFRGHNSLLDCIASCADWEVNDDGSYRCIVYSSSEDGVLKIWRVTDPAPNIAQ